MTEFKDPSKVITDLVFQNFQLKAELREYKENMKCIANRFYCIGGFMNDYQCKLPKKVLKDLINLRQYIVDDNGEDL